MTEFIYAIRDGEGYWFREILKDGEASFVTNHNAAQHYDNAVAALEERDVLSNLLQDENLSVRQIGDRPMKKIAIVATTLLLATAMPATAGHYGGGGGTDWGAVAGAGILGALFGAATVPQQQQPQVIVVVPQPVYVVPPQPVYTAPAPTYAPPSGRPAWCSGAGRIWSPATKMCVFE